MLKVSQVQNYRFSFLSQVVVVVVVMAVVTEVEEEEEKQKELVCRRLRNFRSGGGTGW